MTWGPGKGPAAIPKSHVVQSCSRAGSHSSASKRWSGSHPNQFSNSKYHAESFGTSNGGAASPDSSIGSLSSDFLTWSDSPVSELSSIFRSFPWIRMPSAGKRSPGRRAERFSWSQSSQLQHPCLLHSRENSELATGLKKFILI